MAIAQLTYLPRYKPNHLLIIKYAIVFVAGLFIGYGMVPKPVMTVLYLGGIAVCAWFGLREKFEKFFSLLPMLCYTEPYIRGYIKNIPYLGMQYMFIGVFGWFILKNIRKLKPHTNAYLCMVFFAALELLQSLFPDDSSRIKDILGPSISFIVIIIWSSFNRISPQLMHRLLTYFKIATVYLAGMVLVAHLKGNISYEHVESNLESSNGLAPVQLSSYLGFGCILFVISVMNKEEAKYRILNLSLFVLCSTLMLLTLSRGGLYFVVIITALYMFFNKASFKSYFKFILFIPLGWGIYNYVVKQTGGAIVKRFEEKNASHRGDLVLIGFRIFGDDPIIGVGTSNFATQAYYRKYYYQISTAHNEFVRAIAEHGIFGFVYWIFFIWILYDILQRHGPNKEFAVYFFVLFILTVIHNGLKISIQPLLMMMVIANPNVMHVKWKQSKQMIASKFKQSSVALK